MLFFVVLFFSERMNANFRNEPDYDIGGGDLNIRYKWGKYVTLHVSYDNNYNVTYIYHSTTINAQPG